MKSNKTSIIKTQAMKSYTIIAPNFSSNEIKKRFKNIKFFK